MKTIEEIRHARLLQLLQMPEYPTVQSLAVAIQRKPAQVSQWKTRSKRASGGLSTIDSDSARHIEKMCGKPRGWMDNDPKREPPPTASTLSPIAQDLGRMVDDLPEAKRHRLYWIVSYMIRNDYWPEPGGTTPPHAADPDKPPDDDDPPASEDPSPEPSAARLATPRH